MLERRYADGPIAFGYRKRDKPTGSEENYFLAYVFWRKYKGKFAEPDPEDYGYEPDTPHYIPAPLDMAVPAEIYEQVDDVWVAI